MSVDTCSTEINGVKKNVADSYTSNLHSVTSLVHCPGAFVLLVVKHVLLLSWSLNMAACQIYEILFLI